MLYEIKVLLNEQGLYDLLVNGEVVMSMLAKEDIAEGVEYIMQDPDGFAADMIPEHDY